MDILFFLSQKFFYIFFKTHTHFVHSFRSLSLAHSLTSLVPLANARSLVRSHRFVRSLPLALSTRGVFEKNIKKFFSQKEQYIHYSKYYHLTCYTGAAAGRGGWGSGARSAGKGGARGGEGGKNAGRLRWRSHNYSTFIFF